MCFCVFSVISTFVVAWRRLAVLEDDAEPVVVILEGRAARVVARGGQLQHGPIYIYIYIIDIEREIDISLMTLIILIRSLILM